MIKKIAIVIAIAIAAILGYAATRPDDFVVQRSITIKATPEKVYPLINDFRQWAAWSPWEHLDPDMKRTISGATSGKGAVYEWMSVKDDVGQGRMEITDTTAPYKIQIKLDFIQPWQASNQAEFTLTPGTDGTQVNWAMIGKSPFMFKVIQIFMSMDKMVGKDFEKGLSQMKAVAEKP